MTGRSTASRARSAVRRRAKERVEPQKWSQLDAYMARLRASDEQVVVGPWLSELGFELLYWIPLVSWLVERYELPPERMTIVSRGGVGAWYGIEGATYVDLLDAFSADEFRELTERRWASSGGQKQMEFTAFDREAIERTGTPVPPSGQTVLHPGLMYRLFRRFFRERMPIAEALDHLRYRHLPVAPYPEIEERLPDGPFYAVKFYGRPSFPETVENRRAIADAIDALAERAPVVLLETGLQLDDHREMAASRGRTDHEVIRILDGVPAGRNLAAQAAVVARSTALVGTYGGFSYLAPLVGAPSFALYSAPEHFMRSHLDLSRRMASSLGTSMTPVDARSPLALSAAGLRAGGDVAVSR